MRGIPYVVTLAVLTTVIGLAQATDKKPVETSCAKPGAPPNDDFASHHSELSFTLSPSETRTFALPRMDFPVQINVSTSDVRLIVEGVTVELGPMALNAVASYDTAAGVANVTGSPSSASGPGMDSGHVFHYYLIWGPRPLDIKGPPYRDRTYGNPSSFSLVLSIDRHTGQLAVSVEKNDPKSRLTYTNGKINCQVSMYY
jgi:hypothetical protein